MCWIGIVFSMDLLVSLVAGLWAIETACEQVEPSAHDIR
jgi:hypothetical protein